MNGTDPSGLVIVGADAATARQAARLRADHRSVKLPDAFVIATAITHNADALLTTDRGWPEPLTRRLPFETQIVWPAASAGNSVPRRSSTGGPVLHVEIVHGEVCDVRCRQRSTDADCRSCDETISLVQRDAVGGGFAAPEARALTF